MTARPHVLFVDDEPRVLSALRRMLRSRRDEWDMTFAVGAFEAIAALDARPCDVVVSDFRMPDMDGGELLKRVREAHPATARLILSGYTDEAGLVKVVLLAHELINKPCRDDEIVGIVDRLIRLLPTLHGAEVRHEMPDAGDLPNPPSTLRNLFSAVETNGGMIDAVTEVLASDPAAAAMLLRAVATPAVGDGRQPTDTAHAAAQLGLRNVRSLLLMIDLVRGVGGGDATRARWAQELADHALRTAQLAHCLARGTEWADAAFGAGLLLESGQLVLASRMPQVSARNREAWLAGKDPLSSVESAYGLTHAVVGAFLLGRWALPTAIIEVVAGHQPAPPDVRPVDLASTVGLAQAVVESQFGPVCRAGAQPPQVRTDSLDGEVRERLAAWASWQGTGR